MLYRDFQGLKLSALGFGAMRLPVVDGSDGKINEPAAFELVSYAMENGINYYDTAWGYHDGNSEIVLGKALARFPRDKFYLATKFPASARRTWSGWGKSSRNNWRSARWTISISTCSTASVKAILTVIWTPNTAFTTIS